MNPEHFLPKVDESTIEISRREKISLKLLKIERVLTTVKNQYYWPSMKKEMDDYLAKCLDYQNFKDENRHPVGLL